MKTTNKKLHTFLLSASCSRRSAYYFLFNFCLFAFAQQIF